MKLKKIASLALAGVMAVSMLAGCKTDNGSNGSSSTVEPTATGIVAALNNGQSKSNDVKIDFTANSSLDEYLETAVKSLPMLTDAQASQLVTRMTALNGINAWDQSKTLRTNAFYSDNQNYVAFGGTWGTNSNSEKDVNSVTLMTGYVVNAWTEETAVKTAVGKMDAAISALKADDVDKDGKVSNQTLDTTNKYYHTYDYTGNVSMVSEENANGTTTYYFVMVITQNVTQQEYKKG